MGFGQELKRLLKHKGKSVAWLSRTTEIPVNTLYTLIKRDSNAKAEVLVKLSKALEVPIGELLKYIPNADEEEKNSCELLQPKSETIPTNYQVKPVFSGIDELEDALNKATSMIADAEKVISKCKETIIEVDLKINPVILGEEQSQNDSEGIHLPQG